VSIVGKTETLRQPVVTYGQYSRSQLPFCVLEGHEDGEVLRMLTPYSRPRCVDSNQYHDAAHTAIIL